MAFNYNKEIESILKPRIEPDLFEGYYAGEFNAEQNKLFAATLVNISTINYDKFEYLHLILNGHSISCCDEEKLKKYITPNSWQYKSIRECIEEGVYKYFSISFTGILFENEWFILKALTFFGDKADLFEVKKYIKNSTSLKFEEFFKPKIPYEHEVNGRKIPRREVAFEEFKDQPYLVALIRQEKKEKVNKAFSSYLREEFILPFFQKLRISFSEEFEEVNQSTLIFPEHKRFVLFCALVKNNCNKWQLKYFLLIQKTGQFYYWTYFKSATYDNSFFYRLIINDLKQVSDWDDYAFIDSSCTMDNEIFWENHVFKKDNKDRCIYLKEIEFPTLVT